MCMYEIWDGDLFLYAVDTKYEADEAAEAGFQILTSTNWDFGLVPNRVADVFLAQRLFLYRHLGACFFDYLIQICYYILYEKMHN